MASVNKQILVGNLGKDPELKGNNSEKKVVSLSVATEDYKGKGQDGKPQYKTTWHTVSVFGAQADYVLNNLKKGQMVYVEGSTEHQEYEGKWYTRVIANTIVGMGTRTAASNGSSSNGNSSSAPQTGSSSTSNDGGRGAARAAAVQQAAPAPVVEQNGPADDDDLPF